MSKTGIPIPQKKITEFCRRWKVTEFSLFGSVLREDFRPDSDVDGLVTFAQEAHVSLFDLVNMQDELKAIFKREVDLVEKAGLENPFRRREILQTAQRIYAARLA
ncbi:MAG: nucleotidyltransferase family protein [Chloroflexi bacterium]|nr:nucleotidyltransferase family protein [Chloroflexota bacterium]